MKKTVLVVDDFAIMRTMASLPLKGAGFHVVEVQNAMEALEYLKNDQAAADLVITDINMPGLDGIELIHRIRTTFTRFKYVPVIALSSQLKEKEVKEAGGTAFLQKPYIVSHLMNTVRKLLR